MARASKEKYTEERKRNAEHIEKAENKMAS
jgi:hypothetical protein